MQRMEVVNYSDVAPFELLVVFSRRGPAQNGWEWI